MAKVVITHTPKFQLLLDGDEAFYLLELTRNYLGGDLEEEDPNGSEHRRAIWEALNNAMLSQSSVEQKRLKTFSENQR